MTLEARSEAVDRLTRLAARLLGTAYAQVSVITDQQIVGTIHGLDEPPEGPVSPVEDSLCSLTVGQGQPFVVTDARTDPRVCTLPPVTSGRTGSYLGVPLRIGDNAVGALCVFDPQPRQWTSAEVDLLAELGRSVSAELELGALAADLAESTVRLDLGFAAAGIGSFDWDLRTDELQWDDRLREIFGYGRTDVVEHIDSFFGRLHPDDRPRVDASVSAAIAGEGAYAADFRVVRPDGVVRWVSARGQVLTDSAGRPARMLGAAFDATGARTQEERAARVLETMATAFFTLDSSWRFTYVNAKAELVLGRRRDELLGGVVWDLFPAAIGSVFERQYRQAAGTGLPVDFDAYYPPPLDSWYSVRADPGPEGLSVTFVDVTGRRRADEARDAAIAERERALQRAQQEQRRAEAATHRLALLEEVSRSLSETLDPEEAVRRLARLTVPRLADWCMVTVVDDDGTLRDVGRYHRDPALLDDLNHYADLRLRSMDPQAPLHQALRSGQPVVLPALDPGRLAAWVHDEYALTVLDRLRPGSAAVLPLVVRGKVLGVLNMVNTRERGPLPGPTSPPPARWPRGPRWRWTTCAPTPPRAGRPRCCSAACSPTCRSPTTCTSWPTTAPRRRTPRSAGTGTTLSCSPTAPPCSSSATSWATTWGRPRRWASCATCCAASPTPATPHPRRCSAISTRRSAVSA